MVKPWKADVKARRISIADFLAATAGPPRYRAKVMAVGESLASDTTGRRSVLSLLLAEDHRAFVLFNGWVGGDAWSDEINDYTPPVWETVVLECEPSIYEAFGTIPIASPDGWGISGGVAGVELTDQGNPVRFGTAGATIHAISHEGEIREFVMELVLPTPTGVWRWERASGPATFDLVRER